MVGGSAGLRAVNEGDEWTHLPAAYGKREIGGLTALFLVLIPLGGERFPIVNC